MWTGMDRLKTHPFSRETYYLSAMTAITVASSDQHLKMKHPDPGSCAKKSAGRHAHRLLLRGTCRSRHRKHSPTPSSRWPGHDFTSADNASGCRLAAAETRCGASRNTRDSADSERDLRGA